MESSNRGTELKPSQGGDERETSVNEIMRSMTNMRLEASRKEAAKKWADAPDKTKAKVCTLQRLTL